MAEFTVELVGGPHAGRRALRSRRGQPPDEIPVLVGRRPVEGGDDGGSDDGSGDDGRDAGGTSAEPGRFAIYRYSHRDEETDAFVYSYAHDRPAVTPRNRRPPGAGGGG